jgi:hypothetical protein
MGLRSSIKQGDATNSYSYEDVKANRAVRQGTKRSVLDSEGKRFA